MIVSKVFKDAFKKESIINWHSRRLRHRPPSITKLSPRSVQDHSTKPWEWSDLANNPSAASKPNQPGLSDERQLFDNASKEEKDVHKRQHCRHRPPSKKQAFAQSLKSHHLYRLRGGSQAKTNLQTEPRLRLYSTMTRPDQLDRKGSTAYT